jgi:hypothetical protein
MTRRQNKMDNLDFIVKKYGLDLNQRIPIEIPNMGRDNLAELFAELGYQTGAEIGTERGLYAEILCKANPSLKLYCVDPWASYPGYREYVSSEKYNDCYLEAKNRLSPFDCRFIKSVSRDALNLIKDESLDFVYIDGNHEFAYIAEDISGWSKKVRPGGIVAGHDYMMHKDEFKNRVPCHVVWVVGAYTGAYKIKPWFVVGAKNLVPDEIRDSPRSWFYIKK